MKRISLPVKRSSACWFAIWSGIIASVFFINSCTLSGDRYENDSLWTLPLFKEITLQPSSFLDTNTFFCPIHEKKIAWEKSAITGIAAAVRGNLIGLIYAAQDDSGFSRIGIAMGGDGIHFSRVIQPVLFPANDFMKSYEEDAGIGDPRVVENGGVYFLYYLAYDEEGAKLCVASSTDMLNWVKHGPAFTGRFFEEPNSPGSIVLRVTEGHLQAFKINGKYWMFFGEDNVYAATSTDLIHWEPVEDENEESGKRIIESDIDFSESAFALSTDLGVVLLYRTPQGEQRELLLAPEDPALVIDRSEKPFSDSDQPVNLSGITSFKGNLSYYYAQGAEVRGAVAER